MAGSSSTLKTSTGLFERTAEALTAKGQLSISVGAELNAGPSSFSMVRGVLVEWLARFLAQQSCDPDDEQESPVLAVTVAEAAGLWEARISLLQPNTQPAPAIQAETLNTRENRRIFP